MGHNDVVDTRITTTLEDDGHRRRELGEFLRSRRERLPAPAGAGRRRTPGWRREEVAARAGVGLTWYTWLEQGRAANPSPTVIAAVARALDLDDAERAHALTLAGHTAPLPAAPGPAAVADLERLLAALDPAPAYAIDARFDLVAQNAAHAALFVDLAGVPGGERNLLWLVFRHAGVRALLVDRDAEARRILAEFRAAAAGRVDVRLSTLTARLLAESPDFARWWAEADVALPLGRRRRFRHGAGGVATYEQRRLEPLDQRGVQIVVLLPA